MERSADNIFIDFREKRSRVPEFLNKLGVGFEFLDMAADYAMGKDCLVERKTMADFITSVADGRLFRQVAFLASSCKNPLLILEGGGLYSHHRIPDNAIRGILLWVTFTKKVPLIRTFNEYDTACLLRLLSIKNNAIGHAFNNSRRPVVKNFAAGTKPRRIKNISTWQRQVNILTQIPGIGRSTAKNILAAIGSIANLPQTPDSKLIGVPRLGKERIKYIRQTFPTAAMGHNGDLLAEPAGLYVF